MQIFLYFITFAFFFLNHYVMCKFSGEIDLSLPDDKIINTSMRVWNEVKRFSTPPIDHTTKEVNVFIFTTEIYKFMKNYTFIHYIYGIIKHIKTDLGTIFDSRKMKPKVFNIECEDISGPNGMKILSENINSNISTIVLMYHCIYLCESLKPIISSINSKNDIFLLGCLEFDYANHESVIHPSTAPLSSVVKSLMDFAEWKSLCIIYSADYPWKYVAEFTYKSLLTSFDESQLIVRQLMQIKDIELENKKETLVKFLFPKGHGVFLIYGSSLEIVSILRIAYDNELFKKGYQFIFINIYGAHELTVYNGTNYAYPIEINTGQISIVNYNKFSYHYGIFASQLSLYSDLLMSTVFKTWNPIFTGFLYNALFTVATKLSNSNKRWGYQDQFEKSDRMSIIMFANKSVIHFASYIDGKMEKDFEALTERETFSGRTIIPYTKKEKNSTVITELSFYSTYNVAIITFIAILPLLILFMHYVRISRMDSSLYKCKEWVYKFDDLEPIVPNNTFSEKNSYLQDTKQDFDEVDNIRKFHCSVAYLHGKLIGIRRVYGFINVNNRQVLHGFVMLKQLNHININPFLGAVIDNNFSSILSPYCQKGSLQDVLAMKFFTIDEAFRISFAIDICSGMEYLHNSHLLSHGHLKSSNCLVDERWTVKVADFGMESFRAKPKHVTSSNITETEILDLFWTAPELLRMKKSPPRGTAAGDVYSFGIILQEIVLEAPPFVMELWDMEPKHILFRLMKESDFQSFRPAIPKDTPQSILTDLMKSCWEEESTLRPRFHEISSTLRQSNKNRTFCIIDHVMAAKEMKSHKLSLKIIEEKRYLRSETIRLRNYLYRVLPANAEELLNCGLYKRYFCRHHAVCLGLFTFSHLEVCANELKANEFLDLIIALHQCVDKVCENRKVCDAGQIGLSQLLLAGLSAMAICPIRNILECLVELRSGVNSVWSKLCSGTYGGSKINSFSIIEHRVRLKAVVHIGQLASMAINMGMLRVCFAGDTISVLNQVKSFSAASNSIIVTQTARDGMDFINDFLWKPVFRLTTTQQMELLCYSIKSKSGVYNHKQLMDTCVECPPDLPEVNLNNDNDINNVIADNENELFVDVLKLRVLTPAQTISKYKHAKNKTLSLSDNNDRKFFQKQKKKRVVTNPTAADIPNISEITTVDAIVHTASANQTSGQRKSILKDDKTVPPRISVFEPRNSKEGKDVRFAEFLSNVEQVDLIKNFIGNDKILSQEEATFENENVIDDNDDDLKNKSKPISSGLKKSSDTVKTSSNTMMKLKMNNNDNDHFYQVPTRDISQQKQMNASIDRKRKSNDDELDKQPSQMHIKSLMPPGSATSISPLMTTTMRRRSDTLNGAEKASIEIQTMQSILNGLTIEERFQRDEAMDSKNLVQAAKMTAKSKRTVGTQTLKSVLRRLKNIDDRFKVVVPDSEINNKK